MGLLLMLLGEFGWHWRCSY